MVRGRYTVWLLSVLLLAGNPLGAAGVQEFSDPLVPELRSIQTDLMEGRIAAAEARLQRLLLGSPEDPRVHNFLGVVAAQRDDYPAAEASFRRALELAPDLVGAYHNLGRLYQENAHRDPQALDKGIATYQALIRLSPSDLEANFQAATLLHLKGRYALSNGHLDRIPEAARWRSPARILRVANDLAQGRREGVERHITALIAARDLDEVDVLRVAPAFRQAQADDLLARLLAELLRRRQLSVESGEALAALYDEMGDLESARLTLESLAPGHPELPALLVRLAWVSYRGRQYEKALGYLAHARDLSPQDARIHLFFGLTCVELNLAVEAMKSLEQAVSLEPDNPFSNYALGATVMRWREAAEAIPYLEKYARAFPDDPRGQFTLGEAQFLNKDYEQSRRLMTPLVDHPTTSVNAHYYLGLLDRLDQQFDAAREHQAKVLEADPDRVDALAEMGWLYTRQGRLEEAGRMLDRALELEPDHYQANFNLLTLYTRMRDPRAEAQKNRFEQIKEVRWKTYADSLRTIEVVPHQLYPELKLGQDGSR